MSNTGSSSWGAAAPQGPGWWQASDGLWYPPQEQAVAVPVPAAAPAPVFAPPVAAQSGHPVHVSFSGPLEVSSRWRPLYAGFLAILQLFRMIGPLILGLIHTYVAFFTTLFGAKVSPASHEAITSLWRCQWQLTTFALCMRETAPTFDETDPAQLRIAYTGQQVERFGPFLKPFKMIGKIIALLFAGIVTYILIVVGLLSVLLKGAWPQGPRDKVVDFYRRATELNNYLLLSDVKPQD